MVVRVLTHSAFETCLNINEKNIYKNKETLNSQENTNTAEETKSMHQLLDLIMDLRNSQHFRRAKTNGKNHMDWGMEAIKKRI